MAAEALRGSYPPLITPFRDGVVDYDAFARLVDVQVAGGSHGVVVCGTTGEPSSLTPGEREQLVRVAVDAAAGRLPVVAATGSASFDETATLTAAAERAGAAAVLIVTPYYSKPPQRGLIEYFAAVAARTALPVLLYHIPGRAGVGLEPDTVAAIVERAGHVVGLKHAANDLTFVSAVLRRCGGGFRIFAGLEELSFPMLALGAAGLMNAAGNLVPARVAALCEHVFSGDLEAARRLHFALFELNQAIFFDTNPIPIKYMMRRMGLIAANEHRLPLVPATAEVAARLDAVLQRAGLIELPDGGSVRR